MSQDENIINKLKNPEVVSKCKEYGIENLRLFGSYSRWEQTDDSDVDLLYKKNYDIEYKWRWVLDVYDYLQKELGKKIDFINEDYLNIHIKDDVLSHRIQIW